MQVNRPLGTEDLIDRDARSWNEMQRMAFDMFRRYGYVPVETPMFEQTQLFVHGIGTSTDVVGKEMFTVRSPGALKKMGEGAALKPDEVLSLRPEGTAGTVRAVAQNNLLPTGGAPVKLMYAGPMFRAERPQRGRLRQFHQIGVECLGAHDASIDAETVIMLMRFFEQIGIPGESMRLLVNSMGDENCRPAYRTAIRDYILAHSEDLCDECNRRADTNPLRAFDCKNERCREVMEGAPKISDALCDDCREHYTRFKRHLDDNGIAYEEDPRLVRGLDYYTNTVFEVQVTDGLGSQNAIGGGGRYDKLMSIVSGKDAPGFGFAIGYERIMLALGAAGVDLVGEDALDVYVASVDDSCRDTAFNVMMSLRDAGLFAEADHQGRSLKSQFKQADRYGASICVVLGPDELAEGQVAVRDLATHEQERVRIDDITGYCVDAMQRR